MVINIMLGGIAVYLAAGLLFAILFVTKGLDKVDEGSHGAGIGFRIIIIPGCIVFWPLLLRKWMSMTKKPPAP